MHVGNFLAVGAMLLSLAGCEKHKPSWHYPTSPSTTRPASVPAANVLTPPTQEDMVHVAGAASDASIANAIRVHLGPATPPWQIVAARDIGEYVLLWIAFPGIADGGIDLVYSKSNGKIACHFTGGQRG